MRVSYRPPTAEVHELPLYAHLEGRGVTIHRAFLLRRINCTKLWRDVTSRKWPDRKISLSLSLSLSLSHSLTLFSAARYAEGFIGRPNVVEAALTKIEHRPVCVREFLRAEGGISKIVGQ